MPVPEDNPITVEKIELGRRLFGDRRLSRDGTIACTSCHDPERAFSAPAAIAPGVFGRLGKRNAPALINRGWGRAFFWDGRAATLEEQVLQPIEDPNEMDLARGRGRSPRRPFTSRDLTRAGDLHPIDPVRQLALRQVRERRPCRALGGGRGRTAHLSREGQLHRLSCRPELVGRTVSQHRHRLVDRGAAPLEGSWTKDAARSPASPKIAARSRPRRCARSRAPRRTCMTARSRRSNRSWTTTIAAATGTPGSIPSCGRSASPKRRNQPWSRFSGRCPPRPTLQGKELEARAYTGPASKLLPK